jgi:hypothetical protein
MPTFKPPYGPKDVTQHVFRPAQHLGYRYVVAYLTDGGAPATYILRACAEAHDEKAPKDAVCHTDTGWKRRGDLTNIMVGRKLDTYARALLKYEEELNNERNQQRST